MPDIRLFCFGLPRITARDVERVVERRKALALAVCLALAPSADDVFRLPVLDELPARELLGILTPQTVAAYPAVAEYPEEARDLVQRGLLEPVSERCLQMHASLVVHARSLLEE